MVGRFDVKSPDDGQLLVVPHGPRKESEIDSSYKEFGNNETDYDHDAVVVKPKPVEGGIHSPTRRQFDSFHCQ